MTIVGGGGGGGLDAERCLDSEGSVGPNVKFRLADLRGCCRRRWLESLTKLMV